jgi:glycosidase
MKKEVRLWVLNLALLFLVFMPSRIEGQGQRDSQSAFTQNWTISGISVPPTNLDWIDSAVFYQIYPQTFYDSNGDGVGDLRGIIDKLDYVKSLGVSAIWLNPFYESPFRDAGYDVTDFYKVAPRYGSNEDAKKLFSEVHQRGMRIIIDYVPGYTSIDHPWFKASCDPKPNKYTNWFVWTNATWFAGMEKYKGNFIQGYCDRDGEFMSNFFWHQPALNYGYAKPDPAQPWQLPPNHSDILALKEEMKNVMRFWLNLGCDGFRVDMAGSVVKNDEGAETSKYWKNVRDFLDKEFPGKFLISEWSNPKAAMNGGFHADFFHWFNGYDDLFQKEKGRGPFSAGYSFFDATGKGNITRFLELYLDQYNASKSKGYISVPFGNHDLIRIKNNGRTDKDLEVIFAFMLTMPGCPFIYYGDEIGMKQLYNLPTTEGSYGVRAGARTPMQWTSGPNKGFSTATSSKLYRAVDTATDAPDVASQEKNPNSLMNKVKALIKLHNLEPALLSYAEFAPVYAERDKYPFVYLRANGNSRLLIAMNPANRDVSVTFPLKYKGQAPQLLSGAGTATVSGNDITVNLKGVSYAVFRANAMN